MHGRGRGLHRSTLTAQGPNAPEVKTKKTAVVPIRKIPPTTTTTTTTTRDSSGGNKDACVPQWLRSCSPQWLSGVACHPPPALRLRCPGMSRCFCRAWRKRPAEPAACDTNGRCGAREDSVSRNALPGHGPLPPLSPLRSPQSRPRATVAEPSTSAVAAEPAKYAGVQPRSVATWEFAKEVIAEPATSAAIGRCGASEAGRCCVVSPFHCFTVSLAHSPP